MLKRIQIKGFRSCKDLTIDGSGYVTALVGRNGSGKTNILRAINLCAQVATASDAMPLLRDHLRSDVPRLSFQADVAIKSLLYRYRFSVGLNPIQQARLPRGYELDLEESLHVLARKDQWESVLNRKNEQVRVVGRSEPLSLKTVASSLPAIPALLPDATDLLQHIDPLLAFFRGARYYPFEESNEVEGRDARPLISDDSYQQWVNEFRTAGTPGGSVLTRLLYAHHEKQPLFQELGTLLGPKGLELIHSIHVDTFSLPPFPDGKEGAQKQRRYHRIQFRLGRLLGGGSEDYTFDQLSLGTRRVLNILLSLIVDGSTLMLVEHPEEGIHCGLLKKLVDLLRVNSDPAQIILSSHAAEVFNALRPEDLRLVTIRRGSSAARALTTNEVAAASRFIKEDGSLADFLEHVEEE